MGGLPDSTQKSRTGPTARVEIPMKLAELSEYPSSGGIVLEWLRAMWSDANDVFASTLQPSADRPGAVIAVSAHAPVGVLAYKRFQAASQTQPELWINALYVVPEQRRRGIGRQLIQFAMEHATPRFADELFVYTDVPGLYEALGWRTLDFSEEFKSHTLSWNASSTT